MRKAFILGATLLLSIAANSQTLCVNKGDVTYAIAASQAGEMLFSDGTTLTINGKSYLLSDLTNITIDESNVSDNTVAVAYGGTSAKVVISGNLAPYVTAEVTGAHVKVFAAPTLAQKVSYTLSGSSTDGSFYMEGSQGMELVLNSLALANPDSAAINIQNGKMIAIKLADGTTNSLSDGLTHVSDDGSDGHNAAFYVDGHSSWSGKGSLTITGNVKHGFSGDEYVLLTPDLGTITVSQAPSDGFHINQYFKQQGGTLSITCVGDGIDVGKKKTDKEENGKLFIEDGTLTIVTTGNATKALKCESDMLVSGGFVTATTTGSAIYDSSEADISSNAAAKCDGSFTMSGGTMNLTSTGDGGKGINSTGAVTISGGTLTVVTTGNVFAYGADDTKPQGIKSDSNIILSGGTVLSCASSDSGNPFKTDLSVYTNGATLMGVGNKAVTPVSTSTCKYKKYSNVKVNGGNTLSYDGVSFTIPVGYNNSSAKVIVSSPSM
ncbi:MAG: carbohydrate-binding domain-containing protein [Prevotella sp.]|nr:carbohydrate-binding domain-containing protein [Prevotella sp.]